MSSRQLPHEFPIVDHEKYRDEINLLGRCRLWRRQHGLDSNLNTARTGILTELRQATQQTEVALGNKGLASSPHDLTRSTALIGLLDAEYIYCAAMGAEIEELIMGCKFLVQMRLRYEETDPIAFALCTNITDTFRAGMVEALPELTKTFKAHQILMAEQIARELEDTKRQEEEQLRREVLRQEEEARLAEIAKNKALREQFAARLCSRDEESITCKLPSERRTQVLACLGLDTQYGQKCIGSEYEISVTIKRHSRVGLRQMCTQQFEDTTDIDNHGIEIPECAICQDDESTDKWRRLTCKHMFHELCLAKWMDSDSKSQCPMCRGEFRYAIRPLIDDESATPVPRSLFHEFEPLKRIKPRE